MSVDSLINALAEHVNLGVASSDGREIYGHGRGGDDLRPQLAHFAELLAKHCAEAERRRCANVCFERALTVSKTASAWAAAMACADDIRQLE